MKNPGLNKIENPTTKKDLKDNKSIIKNHTSIKRVGRPSINIEDFEQEIFDLLSIGASITQVLNYIGISAETYYRQLSHNKRLSDKFSRAREYTSVKAKRNVAERIEKGDVEVSKWHLDRTDYRPKEVTAFSSDDSNVKFIITRG